MYKSESQNSEEHTWRFLTCSSRFVEVTFFTIFIISSSSTFETVGIVGLCDRNFFA